jgi:hypothetical protein
LVWSEKNFEKYGYYTCGETYAHDHLDARYEDLDNDGKTDVTLFGYTDIHCDDLKREGDSVHSTIIKVDELPVSKHFILK